ncbi:MAG: hypothetical protein ACK56I_35635, partial [bacterium]
VRLAPDDLRHRRRFADHDRLCDFMAAEEGGLSHLPGRKRGCRLGGPRRSHVGLALARRGDPHPGRAIVADPPRRLAAGAPAVDAFEQSLGDDERRLQAAGRPALRIDR